MFENYGFLLAGLITLGLGFFERKEWKEKVEVYKVMYRIGGILIFAWAVITIMNKIIPS